MCLYAILHNPSVPRRVGSFVDRGVGCLLFGLKSAEPSKKMSNATVSQDRLEEEDDRRCIRDVERDQQCVSNEWGAWAGAKKWM